MPPLVPVADEPLLSFNSLSRDHVFGKECDNESDNNYFQFPLSGSHDYTKYGWPVCGRDGLSIPSLGITKHLNTKSQLK